MRYTELKKLIGLQAEYIIASDLRLEKHGNYYTCPITNHAEKHFHTQWYNDSLHFFCHNCKRSYDIIDHASTKPDKSQYLHDLAGVKFEKKQFRTLNPVVKTYNQSGIEYLQSRKISVETAKAYKVTSDSKLLYFHYITPDNKILKIKKRTFPEKKFFAEPDGTEILYGLHLLKNQKICIICEGEPDALACYEILKRENQTDYILCSSVPNGAKSLTAKLVETCREWLDQFEKIVVVPDNDAAGEEMELTALEFLSEYQLGIITMPAGYKDVNELLTKNHPEPAKVISNIKLLIPELKTVKKSTAIGKTSIINGLKSGYITWDHNDNGLKQGCLTVLTGKTGDGKTSYARQILISAAKQQTYSFMFVGETTVEKENAKLCRYCADYGELTTHYGIADSINYLPSNEAIEKYNKHYADFIYLTDLALIKQKTTNGIFPALMAELAIMARNYAVKLFIIDNLMVLCEKQGAALFSEQKDIALRLKAFAEKHKVHVILIAHPKKGNGEQDVSGAAELLNICDTIIRYVRIDEDRKEKLIKDYPDKVDALKKASALIKTEKVRDDGRKKTALLEWDGEKGALYDLSDLPAAQAYEAEGFWTKSMTQKTNQVYKD